MKSNIQNIREGLNCHGMLIPSPDVGARERLGASFHRYIHSAAYLPSPPSSVFNVLLSAALQCNIVLLSEQSTFFFCCCLHAPVACKHFFFWDFGVSAGLSTSVCRLWECSRCCPSKCHLCLVQCSGSFLFIF